MEIYTCTYTAQGALPSKKSIDDSTASTRYSSMLKKQECVQSHFGDLNNFRPHIVLYLYTSRVRDYDINQGSGLARENRVW